MLSTRYELPKLFSPALNIVAVEVGTDQGVLASDWLRNYPRLFLHTVDPWLPFVENTDDRTYARNQYKLNMRTFKRRYKHWEMSSLEAAVTMCQQSIGQVDFVYVDAAHDEFNVHQDLQLWWPLVKVGGILAGHDFDTYDVARPVIAFVKKHRLNLQLICEHGDPDMAKDNGVLRQGSGQDRYGGWAHISWYFRKEQ